LRSKDSTKENFKKLDYAQQNIRAIQSNLINNMPKKLKNKIYD